MRIFHSDQSRRHDAPTYFRRGRLIDHPESPARYDALLSAAIGAGLESRTPADAGMDPLLKVHSADYLTFLQTAWSRRAEIDETAEELLNGHFAKPQMHRRPTGLLGLLGYYACDTSTCIREGTWDAVYWSAQSAIAAAEDCLGEGASYALCRPPGHHAFADASAGFCYLNNSAIAAAYLRDRTGGRVAVLDVDVHHGNGTQAIFYDSADVLTLSIHCDTSDYYPFYAGYADERGKGAGEGLNVNLPLPKQSGDAVFLDAVCEALSLCRKANVEALVVALGLDAAKDDPLGAFNVTAEGFAEASTLISQLALPSVLVQEGGYLCDALPKNLAAFLTAWNAPRA